MDLTILRRTPSVGFWRGRCFVFGPMGRVNSALICMVLWTAGVHAVDYPYPDYGSYSVCVLSQKQCLQVPSGTNFGSRKSEGGNCAGWVNTVQTLLANIEFDPTKPAHPETTRRAIVDAFKKKKIQKIPGYSSLDELVAEANAQWRYTNIVDQKEDGEVPVLHPVQQAMIDLQGEQPGLWRRIFTLPEGVTQSQRAEAMRDLLDERLRLGLPLQLGIQLKDADNGHAVLAVGMEAISKDRKAHKFYILDPNEPESLKTLRVESLNVDDSKDDMVFLYDAFSWEGTGSADQIAEKRQQLRQLVREAQSTKNALKRGVLWEQIRQGKNELRKLMGDVRVEVINDNEKTRKLLDLAFHPHQLKTDGDPAAGLEALGRIFGLPPSCPLPAPTGARGTTGAPPEWRHGDMQRIGTGEKPGRARL